MRVVSKLLRGSLMAALFSVAAACLLGADPDIAALRIKAEAGDAEAEFNLGRALGDTKETTEAIKWFRKAADQGYPFAEARLGMVYATGSGVDSGLKQDIPEGLKWLRKAAEQDAGLAEFLGMQLSGVMGDKSRLPKDPSEALKWTRRAAEQGKAFSQSSLGEMYLNGEGAPPDKAEAAKWIRKAAEQGDAHAEVDLGLMYKEGVGVEKDLAEAAKWIRMAANQGNATAQNSMGVMYMQGNGVLKDEVEGLAWYNLAALSGDENSVKNRANVERRLGQQATLAAQQRSKELLAEIDAAKAKKLTDEKTKGDQPGGAPLPKASGTGTIVTAQGHVLTAAHVVAGSTTIRVVTSQGTKSAKVLQVDEANDIAVLKISDGTFIPLAVVPSRAVKLGQPVATIGFPNPDFQGFSPKVTRGEISSANGFADDPRSWQISVPVQPGNSGGPLLDENGNLVGIVESKLGLKAAEATGDIPQNVNYAVKSAYATALLDPYLDNNAPAPKLADPKLKFEDMVARAQQSVVLILVY
jgi:hypothetical protein